MMPHTLQKNVKIPKYNTLHVAIDQDPLSVKERERERMKGEKKDIFELLCYQPISDYLSITLKSFYSSSCLSTSPFPSSSLSHILKLSLSLSPGVRMRVGHRGDLRALQPLSARCVCKKGGACKENSNYSFI